MDQTDHDFEDASQILMNDIQQNFHQARPGGAPKVPTPRVSSCHSTWGSWGTSQPHALLGVAQREVCDAGPCSARSAVSRRKEGKSRGVKTEGGQVPRCQAARNRPRRLDQGACDRTDA